MDVLFEWNSIQVICNCFMFWYWKRIENINCYVMHVNKNETTALENQPHYSVDDILWVCCSAISQWHSFGFRLVAKKYLKGFNSFAILFNYDRSRHFIDFIVPILVNRYTNIYSCWMADDSILIDFIRIDPSKKCSQSSREPKKKQKRNNT